MSVICVVFRSQIRKYLQILVKISSTNFHKNSSSGNRAVACGETDRHSEGQKDRSTGRRADEQTDRRAGGQKCRRTDGQAELGEL